MQGFEGKQFLYDVYYPKAQMMTFKIDGGVLVQEMCTGCCYFKHWE